jgi:phenylacetate-coenzyme A ligase PaaK-like adenylate-forming protein
MSRKMAIRDTGIFMFDSDVEAMPRAVLAKLQMDRLRQTLERALCQRAHYHAEIRSRGVNRPT